MPPEKSLDPDESMWRYLAARLRFYRTRAGLSQNELGVRVHSSGSFVSAVELGERRPKRDFVEACDRELHADGDLVSVFGHAFRSTQPLPSWVLPYAQEERRASRIRNYEPQVIPGLLQSAAYARCLFEQLRLPSGEVERRVEARIERQAILRREEGAPRLWTVVDECALNRLCATARVAHAQLDHMLALLELPNVIIEILPVECGLHSGMDGAFHLLDIPGRGQLGYAETVGDGQLIIDDERVTDMERRYDLLRAETLPASRSAQLSRELLEKSA